MLLSGRCSLISFSEWAVVGKCSLILVSSIVVGFFSCSICCRLCVPHSSKSFSSTFPLAILIKNVFICLRLLSFIISISSVLKQVARFTLQTILIVFKESQRIFFTISLFSTSKIFSYALVEEVCEHD